MFGAPHDLQRNRRSTPASLHPTELDPELKDGRTDAGAHQRNYTKILISEQCTLKSRVLKLAYHSQELAPLSCKKEKDTAKSIIRMYPYSGQNSK